MAVKIDIEKYLKSRKKHLGTCYKEVRDRERWCVNYNLWKVYTPVIIHQLPMSIPH